MERILSLQMKVGETIYILSKDGTLIEETIAYIKIIENDEKIYYNAKDEIICTDNDISITNILQMYFKNKHLKETVYIGHIHQKKDKKGK